MSDSGLDFLRARREGMRWIMLLALNYARPSNAHEKLILTAVQGVYPDVTSSELRRELGYLAERELIDLDRAPHGAWFAKLTRTGIDLVEYSVDCDPGIARPEKYWEV